MKSRSQYPARPRADVEADCPWVGPEPVDCRSEPSVSHKGLYASVTYDALAVRTDRASRRRKTREFQQVERSFRTTGMDQNNVRSGKIR